MTIKETNIKDCFIIEPQVFSDNRGYFFESFNQELFNQKTGLKIEFVQDNESFSSKGVLRGLHLQTGNYAQAKLVRVIKGRVLDIAVDVRPNSKTFGAHIAIELSAQNKKQLFIPRGFAHGFLTLEENTIFSYKCDNYYNKSAEAGIIYNDATLNINWQLPEKDLILSEKDKTLPTFNAIQNVL
ncbi:MAG TPA: dTDP-4-dehydrorhamnose 3,5-epimerase [Flavobacteriaceae bacterium]|nr:dTDP-4-dehydrorhamnose 3,5-epimerase [Flavobacteriaceae bacterium]